LIFQDVNHNTIINQIIIHKESGINTNIFPNFSISELGQTLKSSIIYNRVVIHKNCNISASYSLFFDKLNIIHAKENNINDHIIELNQTIAVNINKADRIYINI
jgi:hypothetical protein